MGFYRKEGDSIVYNGKGYLVYYIPEIYFSTKCAVNSGEFINLLGLFNYAIFDDNNKMTKPITMFDFPSIFLCRPGEVEKVKDLQIEKNTKSQDYRLLKFRDGDKLIVQEKVPQDIENVEEFFRLFVIAGNSPTTISYLDAYKPYIDSMECNGESYNISMQMFGVLISENHRDPEDKSKPFRFSRAKKNKEWTNYVIAPIKEIPNYISPYVEITSENFDDSLIQATMMTDKKIKSSPLEKVLTGK